MKYLCLILGVLLLALSLITWIIYGNIGQSNAGYVFAGIAGAFIAGWGVSIHEREIGNKNEN